MAKTVIKGLAEAIKNTERMMKIVAESRTEALDEIGMRGVGITKMNTPVDDGRLRQSMSYTIAGKTIGDGIRKDMIYENKADDSVVVGTNVEYAPFVEFIPTSKSANLGFMLRSYRNLQPVARAILKKVLGGVKL